MQKTQNLQDTFLNYIRREKIPVTLFLMNGFQLRGVVRSFDSFVVLIDADGRQQMIYSTRSRRSRRRGRSRSSCRADLPAAPRRKEGRI